MKMTNKHKVLFICVHNSARSQMAEAWANSLCGDLMEAESAGLEPGTIHPLTFRKIRDSIRDKVEDLCREIKNI